MASVEKMEYVRFQKLFPDLAKFSTAYTLDPKRAHAISIQMKSGIKLYFDCDAKSEARFTLTSDPEVIDKMRGGRH